MAAQMPNPTMMTTVPVSDLDQIRLQVQNPAVGNFAYPNLVNTTTPGATYPTLPIAGL